MEGLRLDRYLVLKLHGVSRVKVQEMIKTGMILVNGKKSKPSYVLGVEDIVDVKEAQGNDSAVLRAEQLYLEILYEDKDCLVINKPAGMVVHPGEAGRHMTGTVANAVMDRVDLNVGDALRPGIVHRLDKDTSGALLVAKTSTAYVDFVEQFKKKKVEKFYFALVFGRMEHVEGVIDSPIGRSLKDRKKMSISLSGKEAVTEYVCKHIYEYGDGNLLSLLEVKILTGRTHQIRVHLSAIGHPVLMDDVYGDRRKNTKFRELYGLKRQFLHAWKLNFISPGTGKKIRITAPMDKRFKMILSSLTELS